MKEVEKGRKKLEDKKKGEEKGSANYGKNKGRKTMSDRETRRSVEHCTPHTDGAWLNELGWSQ